MTQFEINGNKYRYVQGGDKVGIITPTRKNYIARAEDISENSQVTAEEVAYYVTILDLN